MNIVLSEHVRAKLQAKHAVSLKDVEECFANRSGGLLEDDREQHRTDPPTPRFIAPNNHGRLLKICFIQRAGRIHLRTCYPPNPTEITIYETYGSQA